MPTISASLMTLAEARGHITFGGRLEKDARGFIARSMAKSHAGDWRDMDGIRAWAKRVGQVIFAEPVRAPVPIRRSEKPLRWLHAALCLLAGLTATVGGAVLVAAPDGSIEHALNGRARIIWR